MQNNWLIISGTSRKGSRSLKVAKFYQQLLAEKNTAANLLSIEELPHEIFDINNKSSVLKQLEHSLIAPAQKVIFVVSEYNGSFPGSLKMLLDCCDTKNSLWHKKAALVGISDGRNGNLRGMDHLTGILNYLKINVLHYKISIATAAKFLNEDGTITDEHILHTFHNQMEEFIKF
jgi:NAD(P)H-dependent FMN reductase